MKVERLKITKIPYKRILFIVIRSKTVKMTEIHSLKAFYYLQRESELGQADLILSVNSINFKPTEIAPYKLRIL